MSVIWTLNLRHLQALIKVAEVQSVSAAADAANLTQPAITKAIAGIERKLNCKLFERMSDGMQPTECATILIRRVKRALSFVSNNKVSLTHMRALIELSEAGSYKLAQVRTGLAASALHRSVNDLSAILGYNLVKKVGNRIMLSGQGKRYYSRCKLAKTELETGIYEVQGHQGRWAGLIRVGAMPLSRAKLLPAAVSAFHKIHPGVRVSVMEGSRAELYDHLCNGDLDFLLGALRPEVEAGPVEQELLFHDKPVIVARKNHPLAGRKNLTEADYAQYPWIVSGAGTPIRKLWAGLFTEGDLPQTPVECGSIMTIRELLLEGDFLSLVSKDQLRAELELDWVSILDVPGLSEQRPIGITTRDDWFPSPIQKDFIHLLRRSVIS